MNGKLVKVIIPIYKPQLKDYERAALDNNLRLLEVLSRNFPEAGAHRYDRIA